MNFQKRGFLQSIECQIVLNWRKTVTLFLTTVLIPIISIAQTESYDVGRKVGDYVGWHAAAEAFKQTKCRSAIKDGNPSYLSRDHFKEAVDYVRKRYRSNVDVQRNLSNEVQLSQMRDNLVRQSAQSIGATLGQNPTPQECGFMNAEIDNQITLAQTRLP